MVTNGLLNIGLGIHDLVGALNSLSSGGGVSQGPAGVHGNHKASPKPHHRYEIYDVNTNKVVKTGISGQPLNTNGTSPRANIQVNQFNREAGTKQFAARIVETNIPGRSAALEAEKTATQLLKKAGHPLNKQILPH